MYCNIVFMIDIFVISKITQYRYYVIAITDVRSLGLSTKWRTLMIKKTMKVRENTFRKLEDPFENGAAKKYVFYVKVDDVAEGIPMATNPRDQKLTSGVATAIKESLLSNDGYFHLKNRGIVLSAESVHYNNKEKIATIIFSDELSHGNIDGGHTYKIVCEHKGENLEQYVQFEVMTGVEDIIENLAEARNTSVQVDAKSMAELAEKFDPIKEGLEGMPFFKRIAFKQNQISVDDETGKKRHICRSGTQPLDDAICTWNIRNLRCPLRYQRSFYDYLLANANSTTAPQIVDRAVKPILDRSEVYSGCYARVSLNFYAFNSNGNKGIACGLGNIQKIRDGESLGGKTTAADDFGAVVDDDFLA